MSKFFFFLLLIFEQTETLSLTGVLAYPIQQANVVVLLIRDGGSLSPQTDLLHVFYQQLISSLDLSVLSEFRANNRSVETVSFEGVYEIDVPDWDTSSPEQLFQHIIQNPQWNDNRVYMIHPPHSYVCKQGWIVGWHISHFAIVFDCKQIPVHKDIFWAGIALAIFWCELLVWCFVIGRFVYLKQNMHITYASAVLIISLPTFGFFFGGAISAVVAFVNNRVYDLWVAVALMILSVVWCVGSTILGLCVVLPSISSSRSLQLSSFTLRNWLITCFILMGALGILAAALIASSFGSNLSVTASHELIEMLVGWWTPHVEDHSITLSTPINAFGACDYCQFEWTTSGSGFAIQKIWSTTLQQCRSFI